MGGGDTSSKVRIPDETEGGGGSYACVTPFSIMHTVLSKAKLASCRDLMDSLYRVLTAFDGRAAVALFPRVKSMDITLSLLYGELSQLYVLLFAPDQDLQGRMMNNLLLLLEGDRITFSITDPPISSDLFFALRLAFPQRTRHLMPFHVGWIEPSKGLAVFFRKWIDPFPERYASWRQFTGDLFTKEEGHELFVRDMIYDVNEGMQYSVGGLRCLLQQGFEPSPAVWFLIFHHFWRNGELYRGDATWFAHFQYLHTRTPDILLSGRLLMNKYGMEVEERMIDVIAEISADCTMLVSGLY